MTKRNKKSMNDLFKKGRVRQARPDSRWALPSELIGIELEVENFETSIHVAQDQLHPEWVMHSDGSLRNGVEWVLSGPLSGADLATAIDKFFDQQYSYTMSERTSTHIHVNASDDMSVDQFRNIFTIMYLIEPAVFRWADENRKWCGYCQPLTDFTPSRLAQILNEDDSEAAFTQAVRGNANNDRYYGLNVAAYAKHGTLEFRYFPCTNNKATLVDWVQFVMEVKRTGLRFEGPDTILSVLSTEAEVDAFFGKYFPASAGKLLLGLDKLDMLQRSASLSALLEVETSDVSGTASFKSGGADTKAFQKLLAVKFKTKPKAKASKTGALDVFTASQEEVLDAAAYNRYREVVAREQELAQQRRDTQRAVDVVSGESNPVIGNMEYFINSAGNVDARPRTARVSVTSDTHRVSPRNRSGSSSS